MNEEAKLTSHSILAAFDRQRRGLDTLHRDLYDRSARVVLSALAVLGKIRDPRSLRLILPLLPQQEEAVQCAAIQAIAEVGGPAGTGVLLDLFKVSKSEKLRCAVLEALAKSAPGDSSVLGLLREQSFSQLVSPQSRAFAAASLVKLRGAESARQVLNSAKPEVIEAIYALAQEAAQIAEPVLLHGVEHYERLTAGGRRLLISIAATASISASSQALLAGLQDVDPQVRQHAYQALGQAIPPDDHFPAIITYLCKHVDPLPNLEEEALAAIERMEQHLAGSAGLSPEIRQEVHGQVRELFKVLSNPERTIGSDSHELGWLIARSREYLEYYADEELRRALLQFLKGSPYYTAERALSMLKASAIRLEVRHFDGYRAIEEIIKNPKRPGMGLIGRELAIAKLGKRELFYRLIRNLRLTRLAGVTGFGADAVQLFLQIFSWAKQAKLFRLANAAFDALAKVDVQKATRVCEECLKLPLFSKICAIGGIHLLKDLNWGELEPAVQKVLEECADPHILLNLVDAFASMVLPLNGGIVKAMVAILARGQDREVLQRVADFLGSQAHFDVFESVTEGFQRAEQWRQSFILSVVERKILAGRVPNREGLIEFLYKILRGDVTAHQPRVAALLWRLGDDYAAKVLREFLLHRKTEEKIDILRFLKGALATEILPALLPLLPSEHAGLQEALRETLLSVEEPRVQSAICDLILTARGSGSMESDLSARAGEKSGVQVDFLQEKKAYRFEKEHVQELAILFTDIVGYSKKAQTLDAMQLTSMIHDYEGILLPMITSHGGELVKKMGDGHLFIFPQALDSVMAAIRLQKALKRFNSYRDEALRLVIRVGIHWGKVVRKEGDVLGNHVNIASRLESSAKPGSILISEALQQLLGGHIHVRDIGPIKVKGISEPLKVYEPYEIMLDLPNQLDPLKSRSQAASAPPAVDNQRLREATATEPKNGEGNKVLVLDRKSLDYLVDTFAQLNRLCGKAERGQAEVRELRQELTRRWNVLKQALARGLKP